MNAVIQNRLGEQLDYTFAEGNQSLRVNDWVVILGHGVTGNKDRPVIVDTANALKLVGFDTVRFSYAGNGDSEGDFRDSTLSKEMGDLDAVIDELVKSYKHVAYIGHSMGGAVGVLQAAKDSRIQCLISLAGMINTQLFAQTEFGDVTPDTGFMWDEKDCPLSSKYMHDLCETVHNVIPLADCIQIPWLLIHGTADDVVLPADTESVQTLKGDSVDVVFIEGADHSFNEQSHKAQMTQAVVEWLKRIAKEHTNTKFSKV
ncbi:MAG TPA: alpha/beta hydrolase [Opitutae bacterium]|nr:alpha/beta hydrolase [Opitutae bacterium]